MADLFDELLESGDDDIITLYNEDKEQEEDFYHVATIDYRGDWYIFLNPVVPDDEIGEDDVIIYRLDEDEEGGDVFSPIEDDDTLNAVYAEYEKEVEKMLKEQKSE